MDNKKFSKEWFLIADADLGSAGFLQNMKPIPIEIICYHCQQSAEKFLKGFLAFMVAKSSKPMIYFNLIKCVKLSMRSLLRLKINVFDLLILE
jgi:hypothetical protein